MSLIKTSICVESDTLKQAKELKINISHVTREALNEAVKAAERARLKSELTEAYTADAKAQKEITEEFRYADQAW